ncbi:MAG: hypothetical protein HGA54_09180 [Actinobacteria bacterium]|nr:hypothetical protein [Actinomycetota bacterium]
MPKELVNNIGKCRHRFYACIGCGECAPPSFSGCYFCGATLSEDELFCPECGSKRPLAPGKDSSEEAPR